MAKPSRDAEEKLAITGRTLQKDEAKAKKTGGETDTSSVCIFSVSYLEQVTANTRISIPNGFLTYRIMSTETKLLRCLLHSHDFSEVDGNSSNFNLLWTGVHLKPDILQGLKDFQRVNHFPRSSELTRKDRLYRNLTRMQHMHGLRHFDFMPPSYVLPNEATELHLAMAAERGPWIVKPVASSRGRGIMIVNQPSHIPTEEPVIVSRYINNPLLIDGYKCDLRLYVAVTSYCPLVVYLYEEGLVRLATVKYSGRKDSLWNPCMHLTNYSVNKYHTDFVTSENPSIEDHGHKWTLSAFLRHLKAHGHDTMLLMQRIEDVIIKTVMAAHLSISMAVTMFVPHRNNCFELYGFDILVDSALKPWLLEVNFSPSLGCETPIDLRVKSCLLSDLLSLVGIPVTDPQKPRSSRGHHPNRLRLHKRVRSADSVAAVNGKYTRSSLLSSEDHQAIREVRAEFRRKGGFVRVLPTCVSWTHYGVLFEHQRDLNRALHLHLFPDTQQAKGLKPLTLRSRSASAILTPISGQERLKQYERSMSAAGYAVDHSAYKKLVLAELTAARDQIKIVTEERDSGCVCSEDDLEAQSSDLKQLIVNKIENGCTLSQSQARRAFAEYLHKIRENLMSLAGKDTPVVGPEGRQLDLITKFLKKASLSLRTPCALQWYPAQINHSARCTLLAKQLGDFLHVYRKETCEKHYGDADANCISAAIFTQFLHQAGSRDLEDVLMRFGRVHNAMSMFLGMPPGSLRPLRQATGKVLPGLLPAPRDKNKVTRNKKPIKPHQT